MSLHFEMAAHGLSFHSLSPFPVRRCTDIDEECFVLSTFIRNNGARNARAALSSMAPVLHQLSVYSDSMRFPMTDARAQYQGSENARQANQSRHAEIKLPANQRREDFCFTNRAFLLSADLMIPYGRCSIPSRETLSKWPYVSPDPLMERRQESGYRVDNLERMGIR